VSLSRDDLEQVGVYVRSHLNEWLPHEVFDLQERIIRVEDELRAQREVMIARFDASDKRFEDMNQRFEDMNQRFDAHQTHMDKRFEAQLAYMNERFREQQAHMDKRFEDARAHSDERFQHVDRQLRVHEWLIGGGMVLLATMMTLYQFLA
jgi:Fe2+ transport system protein B